MSDHKHEDGTKCFICNGGSLDEMKQWQDDMLQKCGFYMHFVNSPEEGYMNAHTHGFDETWNHPDFQIVIRLDPKTVSEIFWNFAKRVKGGEIFTSGMSVDKIIASSLVKLETMIEGSRQVLRVILPDADGRFPDDSDVSPFFERQMHIETDDVTDPEMN